MRSLLLRLALAALLAVASSSVALAAVPSAANSTVDPCFIVCPDGDIPFQVIVRDAGYNPVANSTVVINWCAAPSVSICFLHVCQVTGLTDATGRVTFSLKIGGVAAGNAVAISADGIPLANRPVASPDQNGDLIVDPTDVAIANAKLGAADPTMDLDCDLGPVTQDDLNVQLDHVGHNCDAPVPAAPRSWGAVKLIYR